MHTGALSLLQYKIRPSNPLSCIGEYGPLMAAALGPVAPLIKMVVAFELSSAIAAASAAAYAAACARAGGSQCRVQLTCTVKASVRQQGVVLLQRAHATAARDGGLGA